MRTRSALWQACIAAALAISAHGASAQFVTSDSPTFGSNSLVTDTYSGQTWLNLKVTEGLSFNSIAAGLALGPAFDGFRLATLGEIDALFYDAGFFVNSYAPDSDFSNPVRLSANASFADAFGSFVQGFCGQAAQLIDPAHGVYHLWSAGVSVTSGTVAVAWDDATGGYSTVAYPGIGTWIVSTTLQSPVTPVPEPGTYALMLAGLAATGVVVRRRGLAFSRTL